MKNVRIKEHFEMQIFANISTMNIWNAKKNSIRKVKYRVKKLILFKYSSSTRKYCIGILGILLLNIEVCNKSRDKRMVRSVI